MSRKETTKYIIVAVLVLFFLPLALYLILITPSRIGIVDRSDVGAWIGYYGGVLGGVITLLVMAEIVE